MGFDVQAVQHAGLSVGMRSMAARAERMGGTLQVVSGVSGTQLTVQLKLALASVDTPVTTLPPVSHTLSK